MKGKFGLLPRIIIAIAFRYFIRVIVPKYYCRLMATFNSIFSAFLGFVVPFIIIAFIVPGIAQLGKGSGKLLGVSTAIAYIIYFSCRIYCIISSHPIYFQSLLVEQKVLSWKTQRNF